MNEVKLLRDQINAVINCGGNPKAIRCNSTTHKTILGWFKSHARYKTNIKTNSIFGLDLISDNTVEDGYIHIANK